MRASWSNKTYHTKCIGLRPTRPFSAYQTICAFDLSPWQRNLEVVYKIKEKVLATPARSLTHAFWHIRTLTHMTVSTHIPLLFSHVLEKNSSSCTTLKKVQCKTSFYLKRVREIPVKLKVKVSEGNRCSNYSGACGNYHDGFTKPDYRRPRVSVEWPIWSDDW